MRVVPDACNLDKWGRLEQLYSWVALCCQIFCTTGIEINCPDPKAFIVSFCSPLQFTRDDSVVYTTPPSTWEWPTTKGLPHYKHVLCSMSFSFLRVSLWISVPEGLCLINKHCIISVAGYPEEINTINKKLASGWWQESGKLAWRSVYYEVEK